MHAIILCPRCQKPVSLPAGVDSAASVRCPMCDAEYPLSEAVPPELVPVGDAAEAKEEPAEEENEAVLVGERMSMAAILAARGPRRPPKSTLKTAIEVVAGGLAGCLVAYYGLVIYFGSELPKRGLPRLPLPFVAWLTTPSDKPEGESETPVLVQPARFDPITDRAMPAGPDVPGGKACSGGKKGVQSDGSKSKLHN